MSVRPTPAEFEGQLDIGRIIEAYAQGLGGLGHIMIAYPKLLGSNGAQNLIAIRTVAICASSGHDVIKDSDADMFVTGEMSHHAALRLTMLGKVVLTVFHSNSERIFLRKRLKAQLENKLRPEISTVEVLVSEEDEDPFEIWDMKKMPAFAYD